MRALLACTLVLCACSSGGGGNTPTDDGGGGGGGGGTADLAMPAPGDLSSTAQPDLAATVVLKLAIDDPANLDGPSITSMSLSTTQSLLMRLELPSLAAPVTFLTFHLVNPNGAQMQQRRYAFSADGMPPMVTDPTTQMMLAVHAAQMKDGRTALDFSIPVRGTNLANGAQPLGTWTITVETDGKPEWKITDPIQLTN